MLEITNPFKKDQSAMDIMAPIKELPTEADRYRAYAELSASDMAIVRRETSREDRITMLKYGLIGAGAAVAIIATVSYLYPEEESDEYEDLETDLITDLSE